MGLELTRPLKVANFIEEGKLGGPQIRIVAAAAAMKGRVDTTVIMPEENSEYFRKRCESEGIEYVLLPISRITKEWRVALRYIFFSFFEIVHIVRHLKRNSYDLIHVSGGSWQYKGVIAGKMAGIKVLWHLNDSAMPFFFRKLFSLFSPLADGFIFASKRTEDYYAPLIRNEAQKFLVPAPVNTKLFDPVIVELYEGEFYSKLKGKIVIITVANVNPVKGLDCLIRAAAKVNKSAADVCFIVAGEIYKNQKGLYESLLCLSKSLSVNNVFFIGGQSDIKGLLKFADIYLCTSLAESSPIAVWEAMAMAKPIVSTDVGDVPVFVIEGVCGSIAEVNDHVGLADRVVKYVVNKQLRIEHGANARKVAKEKLDVQICADRHVDAYLSLLHRLAK